jgi:hypothetical protein
VNHIDTEYRPAITVAGFLFRSHYVWTVCMRLTDNRLEPVPGSVIKFNITEFPPVRARDVPGDRWHARRLEHYMSEMLATTYAIVEDNPVGDATAIAWALPLAGKAPVPLAEAEECATACGFKRGLHRPFTLAAGAVGVRLRGLGLLAARAMV